MCMMCGSPGAHGIMLSQRPAHRLFGKLWEGHHEAADAYANHELIERVRVVARRNQGMWRSPIVSLGWNDRPETWRQFVGFAAEPGQSLPPECSEIELPEMEFADAWHGPEDGAVVERYRAMMDWIVDAGRRWDTRHFHQREEYPPEGDLSKPPNLRLMLPLAG